MNMIMPRFASSGAAVLCDMLEKCGDCTIYGIVVSLLTKCLFGLRSVIDIIMVVVFPGS